MIYDQRIVDRRFISIIPTPITAAAAIIANTIGALFGKDPSEAFEKADQHLQKIDELFGANQFQARAEVQDLFSPQASYQITTMIDYSNSSIPMPASSEDRQLLANIIQYSLLQEWPKIRFHDIVVSKPKKNGDTMDGVMQSSVTFSLHSGNIDSFIQACKTNQRILELVQNPASAVSNFRDYDGLVRTIEDYKGYDLTEFVGYSGFTGALPPKKEAGLGKARKYAAELHNTAEINYTH